MDEERAHALVAENKADSEHHAELAEAAAERARAREQRALADQARSEAHEQQGAAADVGSAMADMYEACAQMHDARAEAHAARSERNKRDANRWEREADAHQEHALAAEQRVDAARHLVRAEALGGAAATAEQTEQARAQAAERDRVAHERDERIRRRISRRHAREHRGLRRFRPGPSDTLYSPGMVGTASRWAPTAEQDLDREIAAIGRALEERGPTDRDDLGELVGARFWGPGRFRAALREAEEEGRARRLSRIAYAPPTPTESDQRAK